MLEKFLPDFLDSYQQFKVRQEDSFLPGVVVEDIFSLVEALCFSYEFLQPIREKKKEKLIRMFWLHQGYQVVELGKDLLPEELVQAVEKHHLDALAVSCMLGEPERDLAQLIEGLSGREKKIPLLVGGLTVNQGIAYGLAQALAGESIEKPIMRDPIMLISPLLQALARIKKNLFT